MAKNPRMDRDWRDPIRKSETATDFGLSLARIQWDFFATPTFKGNVPRTNIAYGMAYRWLQEIAKVCGVPYNRSEEHTSELQSLRHLVCRLLLEKKNTKHLTPIILDDTASTLQTSAYHYLV